MLNDMYHQRHDLSAFDEEDRPEANTAPAPFKRGDTVRKTTKRGVAGLSMGETATVLHSTPRYTYVDAYPDTRHGTEHLELVASAPKAPTTTTPENIEYTVIVGIDHVYKTTDRDAAICEAKKCAYKSPGTEVEIIAVYRDSRVLVPLGEAEVTPG